MHASRAFPISLLVILAPVHGAVPPLEGMVLWIMADSAQTNGAQVTRLKDLSGKNNSPTHYTEAGMDPNSPALIKDAYHGHATLRFNGKYTGFGMANIPDIRAVFAVLMKDSLSCTPRKACCSIPPKFWLGQLDGVTNFHPDHGCTILRNDLNEASPLLCFKVNPTAPTYVNKGPAVDARFTDFPFKIGVVNMNASGNVKASTIGRDRNMSDRSYQGDISEIILYNRPIDSATGSEIRNYLGSKYGIEGFPATPVNAVSPGSKPAGEPSLTFLPVQAGALGIQAQGTGTYSLRIFSRDGKMVFTRRGRAPDRADIDVKPMASGWYCASATLGKAEIRRGFVIGN